MHPILFRIGPITVHTYGVLLAVAVWLAIARAARQAPRLGVAPGRLTDFCLWVVVGGLVGARLVYIAQHWPVYRDAPWEILRIDHGGLVFYGGLLGGVVTGAALKHRWRLPGWATADLLVPYLALAQALGRIGCFFNGCCYGRPTTGVWGVLFPGHALACHPTQLYEAAFLFLFSAWLIRRGRRPTAPGTQVGWYAVGYGAWRFAVEFLRGDNPAWLGPLTFSQVVSLPLMLAGIWWLRRSSRRS